MKTLVVDDNSLFRELVGSMLAALGYSDVSFAVSAEDALAQIDREERPFDCFLLDIQMPGMDGIELCRLIRKREIYRHTPVMMLTGMTEKHYIDRAFDAGANDYITKPFARLEVKTRMRNIEVLLSERKSSVEGSSKLSAVARNVATAVRFEDAVLLHDAPWILPFSSMENYLLRLGNMRLINTVAYGVHIENAREIHAQVSGYEFVDILTDVSRSIRDAFGSLPSFVTYAGYGDFCVLVRKSEYVDRPLTQFQINASLQRNAKVAEGQPRVRLGVANTGSLLPLRDPTELLHGAITKARRGIYREFEGFRPWQTKFQNSKCYAG